MTYEHFLRKTFFRVVHLAASRIQHYNPQKMVKNESCSAGAFLTVIQVQILNGMNSRPHPLYARGPQNPLPSTSICTLSLVFILFHSVKNSSLLL